MIRLSLADVMSQPFTHFDRQDFERERLLEKTGAGSNAPRSNAT
jgi:hypothetical protein